MSGQIHDNHPFMDPEEQRDPVRRFRGRLSSPVTIVTSGRGPSAAGATVSSIVVAGESPAYVHLVLGPDSRLVEEIRARGRFLVHVVDDGGRQIADVFAGIRPSPGGLFAAVESVDTPSGPAITGLTTRASCVLESIDDGGDHTLVVGEIVAVELGDLSAPLQWFRGRYRRLESE